MERGVHSPGRRWIARMRRLVAEGARNGIGLRQLWPFLRLDGAWPPTSTSGTDRGKPLGDRRPGNVQRHRSHRRLPHRRTHRLRHRPASASRHPGCWMIRCRASCEEFIEPGEYDSIRSLSRIWSNWDVVFSSMLEVVGEDEGLSVLRQLLVSDEALRREPSLRASAGDLHRPGRGARLSTPMPSLLRSQVATAAGNGVQPETQRLRPARKTLQEFYDTYSLDSSWLSAHYPETRVRFFLRDGLLRIPAPMRWPTAWSG